MLIKHGHRTLSLNKMLLKHGNRTLSLNKMLLKHGHRTLSLNKMLLKHGHRTLSLNKMLLKHGNRTLSLNKMLLKHRNRTLSLKKMLMKHRNRVSFPRVTSHIPPSTIWNTDQTTRAWLRVPITLIGGIVFPEHSTPPPPPPGFTQVQRGAAPSLRISRKESFLSPPHVRDFVKEGYFLYQGTKYGGGGGGENRVPLQSTKYTRLWRRVTPEVTWRPSLLPPLTAKHLLAC